MKDDFEQLADVLARTAACAVTTGCARNHRETVIQALKAGSRAAEHGARLPLAPLLDMAVLSGWPFGSSQLGMSCCNGTSAAAEYDAWLDEMVDAMSRLPREVKRPDYGFLAASSWPGKAFAANGRPAADDAPTFEMAYHHLLSNPKKIDTILRTWSGARSREPKLWQKVWPQAQKPTHSTADTKPPGMWMLFRWYANELLVHESFDHAAGQLYLHADDPAVLPDQARRIQRLKRQKRYERIPVRQTPDEQDPSFGAYSMSLLVKEPFEYVAASIINHWDPRLNRPPAASPPPPIHIHLCWSCGYASPSTLHDWVKTTDCERRMAGTPAAVEGGSGGANAARPSYASTIQGLCALWLEDLRSALRGLPLVFHLHRTGGDRPPPRTVDSQRRTKRRAVRKSDAARAGSAGGPTGDSLTVGKPGLRWKDTVWRGGPLPPGPTVSLLFRRHTLTNAALKEPGFWATDEDSGSVPCGRHRSHWFCCVVSEADLAEMGFHSVDDASDRSFKGDRALCTDPESVIPEYMTHVVVIEDACGGGRFYEVRQRRKADLPEATRQRDGKLVELRPLIRRRDLPYHKDPSFIDFRTEALDVMLDALEARMA